MDGDEDDGSDVVCDVVLYDVYDEVYCCVVMLCSDVVL